MISFNDWEIKKCLRILLAIALANGGLIALSFMGHDIPFLRQIVGFLFLSFVPGILILRILKIHNLGNIEAFLYSVGLSIAFVMFLGLFMNMLYPFVGISGPISIIPLTLTFSIAIAILSGVAYIRGREEKGLGPEHHLAQWSEILSPPVLFLVLLPFLSVLGTSLVNFYQNNILLLILIGLIALVAALVVFNRFIPRRLYPLAVVMIAIALLWHRSLISPYLVGSDIHVEYYFQNIVLADSFWDHTLTGSNILATLSIVLMAPIYSLILNMETVWLLKIIYPLFFSLVPLALFQAYRKQTDDKIAFLSVFFFMSFFVFFTIMTELARQQIAGLFLALSILLFLDKRMNATKRTALLVVFGLSIIVSHYGLSYLYMGLLILSLCLISFARSSMLSKLSVHLNARDRKEASRIQATPNLRNQTYAISSIGAFSTSYVMLFIVSSLFWYMFMAGGSAFATVVGIFHNIYLNLSGMFVGTGLDPDIMQALGLSPMRVGDVEWKIARLVQQITQIFIVVGVFNLITNWRKTKFHLEYTAISLVCMLLIVISIILPYFAAAINMIRIYHVCLFFLAPFCILGGITVFRWLSRVVTKPFQISSNRVYLKILVVLVLIPYFLFNTGFVFEVTGATAFSQSLNTETDFAHFSAQELSGKDWLLLNKEESAIVFSDHIGYWLMLGHIRGRHRVFWGETLNVHDGAYLFLRAWNVEIGEIAPSPEQSFDRIDLQNSPFGKNVLVNSSRIYDNGGAQIWATLQ